MVNEGPNYATLIARFLGSGQSERALAAAREWLAVEPENPAAHRAAAHALVNLDRPGDALPFIAAALRYRPQDDFVHRLASMAHFRLNQPKKADEAVHRAITLNPLDSGHWQQLAWMCHAQRDLASGRKWAEKALALSPRDPNALNLLALCQPPDSDGQLRKIDYLRAALELRPNDPNLLNNLGVYHLSVSRDLAAAEACFRQALHSNPTVPLFRRNLFVALKNRDRIYRALCLPRDLMARVQTTVRRKGKRRPWFILLLVLAWLLVARYVLVALILWAILVWPLVKIYEYRTVGDLKRKAGEIDHRDAGLYGIRRWPLRVRLGIFGLILAGFWTGLAFTLKNALRGDPSATSLLVITGTLLVMVFVVWVVRRNLHSLRVGLANRRRSKKFRALLPTELPGKLLSHE